MGRSYIEKRIIKSGIELCEDRIRMKGTPIVADDLRSMTVRTMSPILQTIYVLLGLLIVVLGVWIHFEVKNMALAVMFLLVGSGNVGYAIHGRPKRAGDLGDEIDLMDLTAEIVKGFVEKSDGNLNA